MTSSSPQPSNPTQLASKRSAVVEFLESIKFSHTVFALPFALIATLLASQGQVPSASILVKIVLAMVGARTWAMGINRLVDAHIDVKNPRTLSRAIPAGRISQKQMIAFSTLGAVLFIAASYWLSLTAFYCSVPVLLILASYSYTKRFTFLCHFWLGLCLGLAPLGAWVAIRNEISLTMLVLSTGIMCWVAGFDIIYALQDEHFDREQKLHSIPARFGTEVALQIARLSHILAAAAFAYFGWKANLGLSYFVGLGLSAALMVSQHTLVRKGNLQHVNLAFFNLNGWIAVTLFVSTAFSLVF